MHDDQINIVVQPQPTSARLPALGKAL